MFWAYPNHKLKGTANIIFQLENYSENPLRKKIYTATFMMLNKNNHLIFSTVLLLKAFGMSRGFLDISNSSFHNISTTACCAFRIEIRSLYIITFSCLNGSHYLHELLVTKKKNRALSNTIKLNFPAPT